MYVWCDLEVLGGGVSDGLGGVGVGEKGRYICFS